MPPGKQPAGYRYVRGLARKAMKSGIKRRDDESERMIRRAMEKEMTKMGEEVEQIDEISLKKMVSAYKQRAMMNRYPGATFGDDDGSADKIDRSEIQQDKTITAIKNRYGGKGLDAAHAAANSPAKPSRGYGDDPTALNARWTKKVMMSGRRKGKLSTSDISGLKNLHRTKLDRIARAQRPNLPEEVEQVDEVNARHSFVATQQALTPRTKDVKASVGTTRRAFAATNKYARRISKLTGGEYSNLS